jgi:DNA-binding XRE family transcriptional regulator
MWAQEVTQKRLSEVVGVSQQAMCHKMQGRVDFTCREMLRICEYLGGTLDELFGDSS